MAILGTADNTATVLVQSKADTKGVDDTSKSLDSLERKADSTSSGMGKLSGAAGAAKLAIAAIGASAAAAGLAVIKSAASFEQTRIGLENMLGSAEDAKSLLSDVSKFAAETPFEFPELAGATKQLVAFGFTGKDAFDTMKQLGDVSAAIGAPIQDLSYLMGTLRTQGRAFTVDIRQFAQRGVPIYEYLAKVLNTNEQAIAGMIEEGKVGFPEVQKAFKLMTSEGGKFHGAMEKQSKSLSGLWSTLSDNIGQAGREILGINQMGDVAEGSIFDMLRDGASGLIEVMPQVVESIKGFMKSVGEAAGQVGEYLGPKLKELFDAINEDLVPILNDLWHNVIEPLIPVIGTALVVAIGAVVDIATALVKAIGWVAREMENGNPIILGLAGAFGTLATAMALDAAFSAITAGMTLLSTVTIPSVMASFSSLAALIATPIVMPAIVVGAAIAALVMVYDQAQKTLAAIDEATAAKTNMENSQADLAQTLYKLRKSGTPKQKANAERIGKKMGVPGFATGVRNFSGGVALVGERGPELVELPKGSSVRTNQESKQIMSGGSKKTYYIEHMNFTTPEATRAFFAAKDQDSRDARDGLSLSRGVA